MQRMYFPDRVNTPGFRHGGEAKLSISVKPQSDEVHPDSLGQSGSISPALDLAYSPITHLGIIASYRSVNSRYIDEDFSSSHTSLYNNDVMGGMFKGKRFELGAGYYMQVANRGFFEVYGGYGQGDISRRGRYNTQFNFSSKYHRFFLQPAIGFRTNNVSLSGGIRFAMNKYYSFSAADTSLSYDIVQGDVNGEVTKINFTLLEPFVNFEVGYRFIKFNVQVGASTPLSKATVSGVFPGYVHVGFVFHYDEHYFRQSYFK
jgi:hypothetical protein